MSKKQQDFIELAQMWCCAGAWETKEKLETWVLWACLLGAMTDKERRRIDWGGGERVGSNEAHKRFVDSAF